MNTLETYVLQKIGENSDSPDVFTDDSVGMAQIRDSINDAIEEICLSTGMLSDSCQIALKQDKSIYKLDMGRSSIAWVTDAWNKGQKRRLEQTDITRLNAFNPRWLVNTGAPEAYFSVGYEHIGFWPKPSADSEVIEIRFAAVPDRYTSDTDRIKLKKSFKWAVVDYAVSEYYASRGDARTAQEYHQRYTSTVLDFIRYPVAQERPWMYQANKGPWPKETSA